MMHCKFIYYLITILSFQWMNYKVPYLWRRAKKKYKFLHRFRNPDTSRFQREPWRMFPSHPYKHVRKRRAVRWINRLVAYPTSMLVPTNDATMVAPSSCVKVFERKPFVYKAVTATPSVTLTATL